MMTVPDSPQWRTVNGFLPLRCPCVIAIGNPVGDCTGCNGTGKIGSVNRIAYDYFIAKGYPKYTGDPRFDIRCRDIDLWPKWVAMDPPVYEYNRAMLYPFITMVIFLVFMFSFMLVATCNHKQPTTPTEQVR